MAFCNSCGATLNDGTKFCNKWGATVSVPRRRLSARPVAVAPPSLHLLRLHQRQRGGL